MRSGHHAFALLCAGLFLLPACDPDGSDREGDGFGILFREPKDCLRMNVGGVELAPPFTVEAYLSTDADAAYQIYSVVVWPGSFAVVRDEDGYLLAAPTTDLEFANGISTPIDIMDGAFHHVALTYDTAAGSRLWLDGSPVATGTVDLLGNPGSTLYFGCWADQRMSFSGIIGEARLSSVLRYEASFEPEWTPFEGDESTLALWHLDEGDGDVAVDEMGTASGVLEGGEWVAFPLHGTVPVPQ